MTTETEIVSYIPPQLYQRVEQFKQQQSLNSIADAINLILEDYFGLHSDQTPTDKSLTTMVEDLSGEISDLKSQVSQLQRHCCMNRERLVHCFYLSHSSDDEDKSQIQLQGA